jgi:hypothetical protein
MTARKPKTSASGDYSHGDVEKEGANEKSTTRARIVTRKRYTVSSLLYRRCGRQHRKKHPSFFCNVSSHHHSLPHKKKITVKIEASIRTKFLSFAQLPSLSFHRCSFRVTTDDFTHLLTTHSLNTLFDKLRPSSVLPFVVRRRTESDVRVLLSAAYHS